MRQLLNKNRSRYSSNKTSSINVDINSSRRLLPFGNVIDTINAYQLYLDEKNNTTRLRLNFNIKPYCTNVLHNLFTEVVQNEGGDNCVALGNEAIEYNGEGQPINTAIKNNLTRVNAIMDTEFSHPAFGKYVYHCGSDIFDNHNFRHRDFFTISGATDNSSKEVFNTLSDYKRDSKGIISETPIFSTEGAKQSHRFDVNNCDTFLTSYSQNIFEKDGWYGFYNPSTIPFEVGIYEEDNIDKPIFINKVMNNNKPCEFYELYPDRSLYSFIPKINKLRGNREEYNWDYCLTYPASENKRPNGCDLVYDNYYNLNGLKIVAQDTGSDTIAYFKTAVKHNFKEGNKIIFKCVFWGEDPVQIEMEVNSVGNSNKELKETWFSVEFTDLAELLPTDSTGGVMWPNEMRVAKVVEDRECDYYFRIFKKVPSMKFLTVSPDVNDILDAETIDEALRGGNISSIIGKAGFARTIYDEQIAQIIFNEDIEIGNIRDNKGRPISELYLTVLKRARGGDLWYLSGETSDSDVEFSHCFSKLTAGLDIPMEEYDNNLKDYNIHCIHNVSETNKAWYSAPKSGKELNEKDIVIEDTDFIGDLVEWDYANCQETVLENAYYRFNTYQREYIGDTFGQFIYHNIETDDNTVTTGNAVGNFEVKEKYFGSESAKANIFCEGYYYQPHYRIPIHEWSDDVDTYYDTMVEYYNYSKNEDGTYSIYTSIPQVLYSGESLTLRYNDIAYECDVVGMPDSNTIIVNLNLDLEDIIDEIDDKISLMLSSYTDTDIDTEESGYIEQNPFEAHQIRCYIKTEKPAGAQYQPGSGNEYRHRMFKKYEYSSDTLKDATFTNNALYLETNIDLYLRRQDPFGLYKLNAIESSDGALTMFNIIGTQLTFTDTVVSEEESTLCD